MWRNAGEGRSLLEQRRHALVDRVQPEVEFDSMSGVEMQDERKPEREEREMKATQKEARQWRLSRGGEWRQVGRSMGGSRPAWNERDRYSREGKQMEMQTKPKFQDQHGGSGDGGVEGAAVVKNRKRQRGEDGGTGDGVGESLAGGEQRKRQRGEDDGMKPMGPKKEAMKPRSTKAIDKPIQWTQINAMGPVSRLMKNQMMSGGRGDEHEHPALRTRKRNADWIGWSTKPGHVYDARTGKAQSGAKGKDKRVPPVESQSHCDAPTEMALRNLPQGAALMVDLRAEGTRAGHTRSHVRFEAANAASDMFWKQLAPVDERNAKLMRTITDGCNPKASNIVVPVRHPIVEPVAATTPNHDIPKIKVQSCEARIKPAGKAHKAPGNDSIVAKERKPKKNKSKKNKSKKNKEGKRRITDTEDAAPKTPSQTPKDISGDALAHAIAVIKNTSTSKIEALFTDSDGSQTRHVPALILPSRPKTRTPEPSVVRVADKKATCRPQAKTKRDTNVNAQADESLRISPEPLLATPKGVQASVVQFRVLRITTGRKITLGTKRTEMKICSVAKGSVSIKLKRRGRTLSSKIAKKGMWKIKGGEKCRVTNRKEKGASVVHVTTIE